MTNTSIRVFETQIYDLINGVPLPNEVKRIIVENVLLKLTNAADVDIAKEKNASMKGEPNEQNS